MPPRRSVSARTGSRPNRGWAYSLNASFTTVPAASKVLLGSFVIGGLIDVTVLRAIGGVAVASDQAAAVEEQIGAVGMIIVTDIAVAAGIASIPGPFTDGADDGWFTHQSFAQTSVGSTGGPIQTVWYPMDTKGKRVWDSKGKTVAIVAENAHASHGLILYYAIRLLSQVRGTR